MAGKALTRNGLKDAVRKSLPYLSRRQAVELIEATLLEVERALRVDGEMSLHGFGSFVVRSSMSEWGGTRGQERAPSLRRERS